MWRTSLVASNAPVGKSLSGRQTLTRLMPRDGRYLSSFGFAPPLSSSLTISTWLLVRLSRGRWATTTLDGLEVDVPLSEPFPGFSRGGDVALLGGRILFWLLWLDIGSAVGSCVALVELFRSVGAELVKPAMVLPMMMTTAIPTPVRAMAEHVIQIVPRFLRRRSTCCRCE
ncbi:hypothetical protein H310_14923 [Aphanomyces invadans]|uniref:Uncharacterized protein n=1 Tax=Aphanomyces invadans TaxID=157072 RepID=A0A024T8F0_9STRA|nr:hypothetical protein H310_14923 [Aphanomyces invadans]ETV90244.1 hypothetical protein H310_14923 [Aphanomyces invadans]|eukprot:XP_008881119.1 hypothetical protein H310_14923 [Aphanomyces invadans]